MHMTRFALAILLAAAAPVTAQQLPTPSPLPPTKPTYLPIVPPEIARIRDAALGDDYAWDITEGLTTEIGQRKAGTEAEARARAWAVAKLKAMGFANVRVDRFAMDVWMRGAEGAEIVSPYPRSSR
jgi:hypothetical protein